MTGHQQHPVEELLDLVDDRLSADRRAAILAHVGQCDRCQREVAALDGARRAAGDTASDAASVPVPAALIGRVRAALDVEDRRAATSAHSVGSALQPTPRRRRLTVGGALGRGLVAGALAIAALALFLFRPGTDTPIPDVAAADYRRFESGDVSLGIRSANATEIESWFAENGAPFLTRVIDLGMMRFELSGGRVQRLGTGTSAFYAYRGPEGALLVCQMYLGRMDDLPPAEEIREHEGIAFHVFSRDGLTLVFWQEGEVVCVLGAGIPRDELVQLAFAKAVRAQRLAA